MRKWVLKVTIPSLQEISKIISCMIDYLNETELSIRLPSVISLEEFSAFLHFELLRSAVFKRMSTKPFRGFLIEHGMLTDEDDDSAYRSFCAKLQVYRAEKAKDYKEAAKDRLPAFNKVDGLDSKRGGLPMNLLHFVQHQMLLDLNVEKGQSPYRFHNYKNYKNSDIVDYYANYDKALYKNIIQNEPFSDDKSLYVAKAISLDNLESDRGTELLYQLSVAFSKQKNLTFEELLQIYYPFAGWMVGKCAIPILTPVGKRSFTVSRHPILFFERYIATIPGWDKTQRDEESNNLLVMSFISANILRTFGRENLDQSEDELIDELYQTIKMEYPIFDSYGISKRKSDFTREWPGKSLSYYRKLVGELYMPRKNTGTSEE